MQVNADKKIGCMKENIRPAVLNLSGADENVSDVEQSI